MNAKPIKEDPVRLRECLEALSDACGHDVFRVQTTGAGRNITLIITCSRKVQEEVIAKLLASELVRATGVTEWSEPEEKGAPGPTEARKATCCARCGAMDGQCSAIGCLTAAERAEQEKT